MARKKNENIECMENVQDNIGTATDRKYKTEKCRILYYNKETKELDIDFHGYGVRIKNADDTDSGFVQIQYAGEIGKPNFSLKI